MRAEPTVSALCDRLVLQTPADDALVLPGPTGERNTYNVAARGRTLCLSASREDRLRQVALVLAMGGLPAWQDDELTRTLLDELPHRVRRAIKIVDDWTTGGDFDAILHHGDRDERLAVAAKVAALEGPIIGIRGYRHGELPRSVDCPMVERVVSVNTTAAGGNASLMTAT